MIVEKAYLEMYPEAKTGDYNFFLNYSGKFNFYNANARKIGNTVVFNLSKEWEKINEDIKTETLEAMRSGKSFKPVTKIITKYRKK